VAEYRHEALAPIFCFSVIGLIFFGRKFAGAEYSPEDGEYEEYSSDVKGELNVGSNFPFRCRIANPEPRKRPWQPGAHHGPHADERGLYGKAERALLVREVVGHQRAEGFHREVETRIHNHQKACPDEHK